MLIPIYEPKFSDGSYGYRPNRSEKDAICKVREYADEGYKYAVCIDLSKYFDTLNHELLMNMLRQDIKDKRLIELIKKYLKSGVMENGVRHKTNEGSPQGGNLSLLLANIYLKKKLKLKVNTEKSCEVSVYSIRNFKFLGFAMGRSRK